MPPDAAPLSHPSKAGDIGCADPVLRLRAAARVSLSQTCVSTAVHNSCHSAVCRLLVVRPYERCLEPNCSHSEDKAFSHLKRMAAARCAVIQPYEACCKIEENRGTSPAALHRSRSVLHPGRTARASAGEGSCLWSIETGNGDLSAWGEES